MIICPSCTKENHDGQQACSECGAYLQATNVQNVMARPVPRCQRCGYIGPWIVGSILRPVDIVVSILLFFIFGIGIIYFIVILIIRLNEDNREKICPHCRGENTWTFYY